jgi:hypothetical protein
MVDEQVDEVDQENVAIEDQIKRQQYSHQQQMQEMGDNDDDELD